MIQDAGEGLTLRRILFEQGGEAGFRGAVDEGGAARTVDERLDALPPGLRSAAPEEVVAVVARVLDLEVIDVLAAGWRKWEELAGAARRSLEVPGETEVVELVDHRMTSAHHPHVEVTVDGKQVARIGVEIELDIDLHAVTAVVSGGRLSALRSGRADVAGKVAIEGVQVVQATRRVELPIEVGLGAGIPLVARPDIVILPPAPTDEPTTAG